MPTTNGFEGDILISMQSAPANEPFRVHPQSNKTVQKRNKHQKSGTKNDACVTATPRLVRISCTQLHIDAIVFQVLLLAAFTACHV
jgi:hypothetical protein